MKIWKTTALIILVTISAQCQVPQKPGLPGVLPTELEMELALSAAPKHLQGEATVYLLGEKGYEIAKKGTNGWSCFVVHGPGIGPPAWDDMISGWCYDDHGMETLGRVQFDRVKYLRQGMGQEEVRNQINSGYASGTYRAPGRMGVIYMLSPVNNVPDHRTGGLFNYPPHVMYYAPYITNEDIGVPESQHMDNPDYVWSGLPYLPRQGPHGFIVQPLGQKEAARLITEHSEIIERVRNYIDLEVKYE